MHTWAHTRRKRARAHFVATKRCAHVYASCVRVYARIFTKNHLIILYYLMNKSLKFHKEWSFRCGDICKTILTFVLFLIFYVFSAFSKFEHQNSKNIENYKLVIWSFGNLISKCSGIAKILPPILVRTVVFNRNYKEKLFIQLLMITLYIKNFPKYRVEPQNIGIWYFLQYIWKTFVCSYH